MVEDEVKMRAKTRKPLLPLSQAARGLGESCWSPGTRSATLRDFCRRRKGTQIVAFWRGRIVPLPQQGAESS